jgi:hypothetical protein
VDSSIQNVFLYEIGEQSKLALLAFSEIEATVNAIIGNDMKPDISPTDSMEEIARKMEDFRKMSDQIKLYRDKCWNHLQSFLTASANISKIFWPAYYENRHDESKEYSQRGIDLRNFLNMSNKSVLNNRDLRNHVEHYDERLHDWAKKSKMRAIVARNLSSVHTDDPYADMANFDMQRYIVSFWGKHYEILPLVEEIRALYQQVRAFS